MRLKTGVSEACYGARGERIVLTLAITRFPLSFQRAIRNLRDGSAMDFVSASVCAVQVVTHSCISELKDVCLTPSEQITYSPDGVFVTGGGS